MERKTSEVITYFSNFNFYFINLTCLIESALSILEFLVFFIIGRNNPKIYNKIINNETTSIALTPFTFI